MTQKLRWIAILTLISAVPFPTEAALFHVQFPLNGRHEYRMGSGMITFSESVGEQKRDDGTILTIDVKNVPLPPGTELFVYIHETEVGKFKLTKQRTGRFVLEAKYPKSTPRIQTGSFVTLKLDDGTIVIW